MLEYLRNRPWGVRVLGVVAILIHFPAHIWLEREDHIYAFRLYVHAIRTGAQD